MRGIEAYDDLLDFRTRMKHIRLDRHSADFGMKAREAKEPIDNLLLALRLLEPDYNDRTGRELRLNPPKPPIIWYGVFTGGYTGDLLSDSSEFVISEAIAEQLIRIGYVAGVPHWGYTSETEFRITKSGRNHLYSELDRRHAEAKTP